MFNAGNGIFNGAIILKILQVITELGAGGAEKIITILANEYGKKGHTVSVISLMGPPDNQTIPEKLKAAGVKITYLNMGKFDLTGLLRLRTEIRKQNPDVVHSHLIHPNILCRLALIGTKLPLINTIHISERRKGKKLFFILDHLTFPLANVCTAVSKASARFHCAICGLKNGSIRTIYNGVNQVELPSPERIAEFRKTMHLDQYTKVIGSIGRLDYQKGYDRLIERIGALDSLIPPGERWLLLILGDGPEREKLQNLIDRLHLANLKIRLGGFYPDAASLMSQFDVFVMPSRYEGYGLALAEAMTLGLPVVSSRVDSLPELCAMYRGAYQLVNMKRDMEGKELAKSIYAMAYAQRSAGQILQTHESMAKEYLALYNEFLKKGEKEKS